MLQMQMPTTEELEAHHASVLEDNARKDRARTAAANRARGYPEPQPGDRLYVTSGRGIKQRARAGILFNEMEPTEVLVIGELDPHPSGVPSAPVSGAELILADPALNVRGRSASDAEAADLRRQLTDRDSELATLRAENARILREARMSAPASNDGSPQRLAAARKAGRGLPDPDGFGGKE